MQTAHNGVPIPHFMYGTAWKKEDTSRYVQLAVQAGFRAIDTANQLIHYHEALVGEALLALAKEGITRDQLFLQTKFTPVSGQDHRTPYDPIAPIAEQVAQSFESSLEHLHTDSIDSYVLHGPYGRWGLDKEDWEVWTAFEKLYQAGRTKMIGISNVQAPQLQLLCEQANVKPMIVQNRCYAASGWDHAVREICRAHHVVYQGFSLLTANREVCYDPDVGAIAKRCKTGPAQIIFRLCPAGRHAPLDRHYRRATHERGSGYRPRWNSLRRKSPGSKAFRYDHETPEQRLRHMIRTLFLALCSVAFFAPATPAQEGHAIPGVSFQVFLNQKQGEEETIRQDVANEAVETVVKAFGILVRDRSQYKRFDQAITNNLLQNVVIEPRVLNKEGKEFPFLVARTKQKGKVNLLINAMRLREGRIPWAAGCPRPETGKRVSMGDQ